MIITTSPHSDTIYYIFNFSIFTINDNYNSIIDDTIYYMFHFFSIFETYQYFLAVWHLFNLVVTKVPRQTRDPTMQILLQHDKRHPKTSVKKIRCPWYRVGTICNVRICIVPRPPQQFYTCNSWYNRKKREYF